MAQDFPLMIVDSKNSTNIPLLAGGVFTGEAIFTEPFAVFVVSVYSDVASAIDGLSIQQSTDLVHWDFTDEFTVPANKGKTYSIQPQVRFFRIVYTNGSSDQTEFRMQSIGKKYYVKPSSHRIQDSIIADDDAELVKSVITYANNNIFTNIDVQNPLPVDGDSLYSKDINVENSDIGTFTGTLSTVFSDYSAEITDTTSTSPKTFTISLHRPIVASSIGIGSLTGDYSNVKIILKDISGTVRETIDDSANNTKYTSNLYPFSPATFIEIVFEFYTTDAVTVSGIFVQKETKTISRLQALKPNGEVTNIDATAGGNLKISLEEVESQISTNGNSQLKVTLYDETGNPAIIDSKTGSFPIIDYSHHEIHEGDHYFIEDISDLVLNNVFDVQFTTLDSTKWKHFIFELNCESETEWYIYEGVTINTPGTAMTPRNNNRNFSDASNTTIASILNTSIALANADTAVASAIELAHGIVGAGRNGGIIERNREIVLKQNTDYCMRVIANTAGYTNFYIGWYEHTNI